MAATLDAITVPYSKYVFTTTLPGSADGGVMLNFAKSIPGARSAELKGLSHFAMLQAPAAFSGALRAFLDSA